MLWSDLAKWFTKFVEWSKTNPKESVLFAVLGAVAGALLKFVFDEWSSNNKARREMMTNVTRRVNALAKDYYWHMANHSSVLATILEHYLEQRQALELRQDDPADLRQERETLIEEATSQSFLHYARLTKLTYEFNFQAGSTFLLRDYWAGRSIQNLQNALRLVLDLNQDLIERVDPPDNDGKPTYSTLSSLLRDRDLDKARENYRKVFEDEDKLRRATKYLKASGDLFNYELKQLYRDWFKNGHLRIPSKSSRFLLARSGLPKDIRVTIRTVDDQSRKAGYAIAPLSMSKSARAGATLEAHLPAPEDASKPPRDEGHRASRQPPVEPPDKPQRDGKDLKGPLSSEL